MAEHNNNIKAILSDNTTSNEQKMDLIIDCVGSYLAHLGHDNVMAAFRQSLCIANAFHYNSETSKCTCNGKVCKDINLTNHIVASVDLHDDNIIMYEVYTPPNIEDSLEVMRKIKRGK